MPHGKRSPRLVITVDSEIHQNVIAAAAQEGISVSAWMTRAACEALQLRAGLAAVALWENQHGAFNKDEMDEACRVVRAQLASIPSARRA